MAREPSSNYNIKGNTLAQGIKCWVRVNLDSEEGPGNKVIGFVQDFNIRKSISVQRAEVLGELLPVSLDPTSIQTTVTMKGFIPSAELLAGISDIPGGGELSMKSFNPDDRKIVKTTLATKIPYLDFVDRATGEVIGSTTWAIVTSYGDSASGKGYVMADITMESIGYDNGAGYGNPVV